MAEESTDEMIVLELSDTELIEGSSILNETLTQDQREEITSIVQEIQGVNSRELIDFTSQEFTIPGNLTNQWHKAISSAELDTLAGNNSSENTQYQTKWAVAVMKGKKVIISYNLKLFEFPSGIYTGL